MIFRPSLLDPYLWGPATSYRTLSTAMWWYKHVQSSFRHNPTGYQWCTTMLRYNNRIKVDNNTMSWIDYSTQDLQRKLLTIVVLLWHLALTLLQHKNAWILNLLILNRIDLIDWVSPSNSVAENIQAICFAPSSGPLGLKFQGLQQPANCRAESFWSPCVWPFQNSQPCNLCFPMIIEISDLCVKPEACGNCITYM